MENEIKFKSTITWEEFGKLRLYSILRTPSGIILISVGAIMILNVIIGLSLGYYGMDRFIWGKLIGPIVLFVVLPLTIRFKGKKAFGANPISKEIIYQINESEVSRMGEDFTTNKSWQKFSKVKETKRWFFLYHNKYAYYLLSKKDMTQKDIEDFKKIANGIPNLKINFRKK